jgi:CO/xanthine dehydrogenase Mo-binding subunit
MGPVDLNGTRTTAWQMVAEALGLPWEKVSVTVGDTENVAYSDVSGGSRITYSMAVVIEKTAREIIDQLIPRAAQRLGVDQGEIEHVDDELRVRGAPEKKVSMEELALQSVRGGEDPIVGRGFASGLPLAPTYATHVADVQVDPERRARCAFWATPPSRTWAWLVNPTQVEGQMQGGAVQGIGWALHEGEAWDDGINRNPTFLDYRMPTALDLPMIGAEIVEVPSNVGPYGLRGVGEVPLVPPKAAIANAIFDAIGVQPDRAPMTPEVILALLKKDSEG